MLLNLCIYVISVKIAYATCVCTFLLVKECLKFGGLGVMINKSCRGTGHKGRILQPGDHAWRAAALDW